jgi:hypothetical protein
VVAALHYSLIESAKLCGVEPKAYLLEISGNSEGGAAKALRDIFDLLRDAAPPR